MQAERAPHKVADGESEHDGDKAGHGRPKKIGGVAQRRVAEHALEDERGVEEIHIHPQHGRL